MSTEINNGIWFCGITDNNLETGEKLPAKLSETEKADFVNKMKDAFGTNNVVYVDALPKIIIGV